MFRLMRFFRRGKVGKHHRSGDRAMAERNWREAAAHYAIVIRDQPENVPVWIQYGHALKELGDFEGARNAYEVAAGRSNGDLDGRLHLARMKHAVGLQIEALDDFVAILQIDPGNMDAYSEIVSSGNRHRITAEVQHKIRSRISSDIATLSHDLERRKEQLAAVSIYAREQYNRFRHDFAITSPPSTPNMPLTIIIDAPRSAPYFIRATLLSLIDQSDKSWRAIVITDAASAEHPVASLGHSDPRVRFAVGPAADTRLADHVLYLSAGTVLDRTAVAWFKYTICRTGCEAAWCDFDHARENWSEPRQYERPHLWGVFDSDLLAQTYYPPALILCSAAIIVSGDMAPEERRRMMLLRSSRNGPVVHIPRVLASVLGTPPRADIAPQGVADIPKWSADPKGSPPLAGFLCEFDIFLQERVGRRSISVAPLIDCKEMIQIIIQTRDEADMLSKAVDTLLAMAVRPEQIILTIVDNRSRDLQTASYLAEIEKEQRADVLMVDAPFNWSRANNLAAMRSDAEILVFANNDIEMLTPGWDDLVRADLQRSDVGVLGARLLYPDGKLQHAGMVFGIGEGGPMHEGPYSESAEERFDLTHNSVAVTGAFMAIRRGLFDRLGGFEELAFAVGYNDVDLCLRARAEGFKILYSPAIELIHHESKTRGMNVSRDKVAWDLGERRSLFARWGDDMRVDPGYNPHWSKERPFDGFREPTVQEILEHIDLSARTNPWLTV